ncbi:unnamed protein product [Cunninghamella blakesleeana]
MLRPFDSVNTKRVIDHSENEESSDLTSSKESPSDNNNSHNKPVLANKQDLLKKKNANNNPILANKHDTNKIFSKPLTPLKRSGSANSISFDTPTKRLDSKYREIESGYQHEEELEYIPEEAIPIDINDFEENIHMGAYEEDLNIKHPELITEDEFSFIKPKRQFQMEKEIKQQQQDILRDDDVFKKPTSKLDLEKAIEASISMPEIRQNVIIEYPNEIEYCPPHEEESEYSFEDIASIDFNDFDDTLVFEAYEGSSDSEVSETLYEIESASYKKSKRQFQLDTMDKQLEQLEKEDSQFLRDEDVYKQPITKQNLIKAIEDSIVFHDMNNILSIESSIDTNDELSFDEVYQFVV